MPANSYQIQKYEKQLDRLYKRFETVVILKDDKAYKKLLKQLQGVLVNTYDDLRSKSIKDVIHYLVNLDSENFNNNDITEINDLIKTKLGKDLPAVVEAEINELTEKIFKVGKKEILSSVDFKFSFDVADKDAVKHLQNFNNFWVENHYDANTRDKLTEVLTGYFNSNLTIDDVANNFAKDFNKLTDKGISYFKNLSHITTNRTRALGQINGLEKAKIIEYELFNPDPQSEICQQMNGMVFPVERALAWRDEFISISDPEDIKEKFGWIGANELVNYFDDSGDVSVDTADLPDGMVIPPLHGGPCKTTIRARFES